MKTTIVKVPGSILLDWHLVGSAKLLWMILQLRARNDHASISSALLEARSGLARHTVLRGLARLESAGWLPTIRNSRHITLQSWVSVPGDLLLDSRVGIQARLLHGILQLTPGFRSPTGQFTYSELSCLTRVSPNTLKHAVRALQDKGWLQISQRNKFSPIHFSLRNPAAERREGEVVEARRRLEEASFVGEALMREYLSLIVDSDEFDDNATPGFLVNPFTGEEMQFDRYYPPRVAFEFNGPQHYGPTALYPKEADIRKQQGRDYIKIGISATRGIKLVVIHPEDLTLEVMRQKVDGLLPLRNLDGHEPLIACLESVSRAYRRKARHDRWAGPIETR
ncbi:MAG: helix-turn-helix domain-containing protein [Actinobacteria bacterium]|nr:helix-turn-helix domain-containing protein [Actinomycetota bacterium]